MAKGGAKPGERRGGRVKGTPNKTTLALEAAIAASGETPRDYMLKVMRDPDAEPARRDAMAKAVAPYVHPHLACTAHTGDDGGPIKIEQIRRIIIEPGHTNRKGVPAAT